MTRTPPGFAGSPLDASLVTGSGLTVTSLCRGGFFTWRRRSARVAPCYQGGVSGGFSVDRFWVAQEPPMAGSQVSCRSLLPLSMV